MKERVMQEVWAKKLLSLETMFTTDGRCLKVMEWGNLNYDQGPDFSNARISLDGIVFFGDIELHLRSADWFRHGHHQDPGYNKVVLHVVMDADPLIAVRQDQTPVPTLSIGDRVSLAGQRRAKQALQNIAQLPCTALLRGAVAEHRGGMLQEAARLRASQKLEEVQRQLRVQGGDWEEAMWPLLAAYLGGPVNKEAFRVIAERVSFAILRKCIQRPLQVEAILFGVAGMLDGSPDAIYPQELHAEWDYLSGKFDLRAPPMPLRLHRMRPASFPVYRLSQLAELLFRFQGLMGLMHDQGIKAFMKARIETTTYWRRNSDFGESSRIAAHAIGMDLKQTLLLNVLLPFRVAYQTMQNPARPVHQLGEAWAAYPPEDNRVTRRFLQQGWLAGDAADTQAMVYLHKHLCSKNGCLQCPVGRKVLSPSAASLV